MGDGRDQRVSTTSAAPGLRAGTVSAVPALLVLVALIALAGPQLAGEWRVFHDRSLIAPDGGAPVPQADAATPALDAALRAAAALLPRDATCVVAVDAWQRTYQRASYLLMPRRVWPASANPATVSAALLGRALASHHAGCLLVPAGQATPPGLRLAHNGAIALYLAGSGIERTAR